MGLSLHQPAFTLTVAGEDRTGVIAGRLQALKVTDTIHHKGDELTLTIDDADNAVATPAHGAVISLSIGYVDGELVDQGQFTVDETEPSGPPDVLEVRAKSADMRASLKAQKSRAWRATTVGAIVRQVAGEHGLTPQVGDALGGVAVAHRDQAGESDLHFLTRLGRENDAVAAPKAGKLVFAPKGQAVSASGKPLDPLVLDRTDLTSWKAVSADRQKHGRVRARHRDAAGAADVYEEAGDADPTLTLRHLHPDAATARQAAHATHSRLKRQAHGVELELPGRPDAFAGRPMQLTGLRDGLSGVWIISKAEHEIDFRGAGYVTRLEATVDGLAADAGDGAAGYGGDDADGGGSGA